MDSTLITNKDAASSDASHRLGESVVPGLAQSSSSHGPQEGLPAGPSWEMDTAAMDAVIDALPSVEFPYGVSGLTSEESSRVSSIVREEGADETDGDPLLAKDFKVASVMEGISPAVLQQESVGFEQDVPCVTAIQQTSEVAGDIADAERMAVEEYILPGDVHVVESKSTDNTRAHKRRASNSPKDGDTDLISGVERNSPILLTPGRRMAGPNIPDSGNSVGNISEFGWSPLNSTGSGTLAGRLVSVINKEGPSVNMELDVADIVSVSSEEDDEIVRRRVRKIKYRKVRTKGTESMRKKQGGVSTSRRDINDIPVVPVVPPDMPSMAASALGAEGIEWINEIEICRVKSGHIQGMISGRVKNRLLLLRDVITILVGKTEASGDPTYLRRRTSELSRQLWDLQEDNKRIKSELDKSKKRIKELEDMERNRSITDLKRKMDTPMNGDQSAGMSVGHKGPTKKVGGGIIREGSRDIALRAVRELGFASSSSSVDPVFRPALKRKSVEISEPPVQTLQILNDQSRREIVLTEQIDSLTETRRALRENLMRGQDHSEHGDRVINSGGLPSHKNSRGPVVISDVKIVPPGTLNPKKLISGSLTDNLAESGLDKDVDIGDWTKAEEGCESWTTPKKTGKRARKRPRRDAGELTFARDSTTGRRPSADLGRPDMVGEVRADVIGGAVAVRGLPARETKTRKPPRTSVVSLKRNVDGPSYADILRKAREHIQLDGLGIERTKIRWAANGAALIEIFGDGNAGKADTLAERLRDVLKGEALVYRPTVKGELRIWGLDDSVSPDEVTCVVADTGSCLPSEVRVGAIARMNNGLGSVWVQCPLSAAVKVSTGGKLRIGWTVARVELLNVRPLQCFRCWQYGHVRSDCKSDVDRTGSCFRCALAGHLARVCTAAPHCVLCETASFPAGHRMDSVTCRASVIGAKGRRNVVSDRRTDNLVTGSNVL